MATVTGMTASAMQAIRDGTITSAHFDSANHLILTKYDGTTVDGGALATATTTQAGSVELATNAETQSGSATNLAVTPAGLASLPGYRVQIVSGLAETATPAAWPYGVSMQSLGAGSGWSLNGGFGTVITSSISSGYTVQEFYKSAGGTSIVQSWERTYNAFDGGGGWTAWRERQLTTILTAASFTQLTAASSYPPGRSKIYYTAANSGSWDFSGMDGEVETHWDSANTFARQTFTQKSTGSTNTPNMWVRTSDNSVGWSAWKKLIHDPGAWIPYTPAWTTSSGLHLPSYGNAVLDCRSIKLGRKVDVRFSITFGSTTNFGAGVLNTDNWYFALPYTAARSGDDGLGFLDMYASATSNGFARVKTMSTTQIGLNIVAGSTANIGADADSLSPFTWASGNTLKGTFTYESAS